MPNAHLTDIRMLRKFFGKQDGVKPAPAKQTKLSFSTKSTNAPKATQGEDDENADMPDAVGDDKKKISTKIEEIVKKENVTPEPESPNGKGRLHHCIIAG
jgi:hypothetical protein